MIVEVQVVVVKVGILMMLVLVVGNVTHELVRLCSVLVCVRVLGIVVV